MKWIKEVKSIGLKDWLWFVVYLRRDEFSRKLDLNRYYPDMDRLNRDRKRAHDIDGKLNERHN